MKFEVEIKVQNVVASAKLGHSIDLGAVVKAYPEVQYMPEIFPGIVFRLKRPQTATLIFRTGGIVCTGAKSAKDARKAVLKVVRKLKRGGIILRSGKPEIVIHNVVATGRMEKAGIDLEKLYASVSSGARIVYETEQFPGLIYYMEDPRVTFLVFRSGNLVCTGAKREEDVYAATEKLVATLKEEGVLYEAP